MAIRIGHASLGESGKVRNGAAGDQTGKEVFIRNWYLHGKGWVVLRCKDAEKREKIAKAMEKACANNQIGYDQNQRDTLFNNVKNNGFDPSKTTKKVETDCSALVRVCVAYAYGKDVTGNFNTSSEASALVKSGLFTKYTESKYCTSSDYLMRGDILCTKTKGHTVIVLDDGAKVKQSDSYKPTVLEWQKAAIADGFVFPQFGADGEWGGECESVAKKALVMQRILTYKYKNLTKIVQKAVGVKADGLCGSKTKKAIKEYQKSVGLPAKDQDGIVGLNTWKKILNV